MNRIKAISELHPGNRFRLMFGMPLLPETPMDTNEPAPLASRDWQAIKTLTRRAEFLEQRVKANEHKPVGVDLDKQEAKCLRRVLKRAYPDQFKENPDRADER